MASTSKGRDSMPELDLVVIARTTRKSLDRLASFSNMRSSSEPLPLLTKISNKIIGFIRLIDSSMLAAQLGYQLTTDAMIMCDTEEKDWDADISLESLREISVNGYETSKAVMEGFRDINQAVYKIAASTKDNMFVVLVPPDPSHTDTMKIHLKDIGTGLVANLNLLSEFSRAMTSVAAWWAYVKEDLESSNPTLLPSQSHAENQESYSTGKFAKWSEMKEGFQQYYNAINVAHSRYPELLVTSSTAWKSVALARSAAASSIGHDERAEQSSALAPSVVENAQPQGSKSKGVKALAGIFGFGRNSKTQPKEISTPKVHEKRDADENTKNNKAKMQEYTHREEGILRQGGSSDSASSRANSPSSSSSTSRSRHVEKEPAVERIKSSFSCCSASLFGDGVGHLGHHGFLLR